MSNLTVIKNENNFVVQTNPDCLPETIIAFLERSNISPGYKRNISRTLRSFVAEYDINQLNTKFLSIEHFNSYKNTLEKKIKMGNLKASTAQGYLNIINLLSKHLFRDKQINFIFKATLIEKSIKTKAKKNVPPVINSFLEDLSFQNYSQLKNYRKDILYFFKFLAEEFKSFPAPDLLQDQDVKKIDKEHIDSYHKFLGRRVSLNEISTSRALNLLRCLKLFLQYIRRLNFISFKYSIPGKFQIQHTRNNEYVNTKETMKLIDAILNYSRLPERNLSVFLIILDTGCRPIEITNMKLQDVSTSESTIVIRSKKSGQRKLKLSNLVMKVLRKYLKYREKLDYNGKTLFLSTSNEPLTVNAIGQIYAAANKKVFGEVKYTAKTYRHAFATNALENKNDLEKVSMALGHARLDSTYYYLEKSIQRLKRNTLQYNPETVLKEES
ncbi:site-specific integrase [Bacillus sp. ISL-41]|uniref:tyrosine-type recombinase/integrase n=1 Tax=Bacillus sp. ISL-41 TaxID=2819127 RepID=UPI001BE919C7|nr:site-specific integrase [Bacillus sp. ISL-41]MBT2642530.1 site-specific integrase [Bacillus sp. ISL-41]